MNGVTAQPDLHIAPHAVRRMGAALRKQDHGAFTFWLGVALAIHALALIGFVATPPREIGDPNGFKDAIAIEMVSDADLRSMSSVADRAPAALRRRRGPAPSRLCCCAR